MRPRKFFAAAAARPWRIALWLGPCCLLGLRLGRDMTQDSGESIGARGRKRAEDILHVKREMVSSLEMERTKKKRSLDKTVAGDVFLMSVRTGIRLLLLRVFIQD